MDRRRKGGKSVHIMLDPGHGGSDSGAVANGIREKDVNLAVALLTRDILLSQGIDVLMTRTTDSYVSLAERTDRANGEKVEAFISIHHNAASNLEARGMEIYHSVVSSEGKGLAELIHDQYRALIPELPSRGIRTRANDDGSDYYHIIRETQMPAVIIEGGFLTNRYDAALIKTSSFQEKQAQAISQAIVLWRPKETSKGRGTPILGPPQVTVEQAQKWAKVREGHQRFIDIAPVYWQLGQQMGIRPEVAYCQAAKETAFGQYGGAVLPEQNNWAGIKTRDAAGERSEDHETFPTPEEGVRAHFNHLAAYVGVSPLGEPHGRYYIVKGLSWAGSVRYVEELGGKWAPNQDYGTSIVRDYLAGLLATKVAEPEPDDYTRELEARIARLENKLVAIKKIIEN